MAIAFGLLLALIVSVPILIFADGLLALGLIALGTAVAAVAVAVSVRPRQAAHFVGAIKTVVPLMLVPVVVMAAQLLPLPLSSFSRSIWDSAAAALGGNLIAINSIDPGATVIALGRYVTLAAIVVVAAALTIERRSAELVLVLLAAVSVLAATLVIVHDYSGLTFLGAITTTGGPRSAIAAAGAFGMVLSAACADLVVERRETGHYRAYGSWTNTGIALGLTLLGLFASGWALLMSAMAQALFAGGCGVATVAVLILIRRLDLGRWSIGFLLAVAGLSAAMIALAWPASTDVDVTLRYAMRAPLPLLGTAGRMLADIGWLGSGAGTFAALLPIYRDFGPGLDVSGAPTWAALLSIELGRASFWIILMCIALLGAILVRGAIGRGRDSFYAIAGVAGVVTVVVYAFVDAGLANSGVSAMLAALLGLALAQNDSRAM